MVRDTCAITTPSEPCGDGNVGRGGSEMIVGVNVVWYRGNGEGVDADLCKYNKTNLLLKFENTDV